ncbi:MAG: hypothetical protein WC966_10410 [Bradymonadales bacterium]|jgi:hypothetical protein
MKPSFTRILFASLLAIALLAFAPTRHAHAEAGLGGFDILIGIGAQACHSLDKSNSACNRDVFEAGPLGSFSAGYVADIAGILGVGLFADLDLGGMPRDEYKSSFILQANGMLKFFIRAVVLDIWLGIGGGYSYYTATLDTNTNNSWSWKGPSLKASAGLTFFLPVFSVIGLGIDYSYIHSFEGNFSSTVLGFDFATEQKQSLFDLSQVKFHVRFNF